MAEHTFAGLTCSAVEDLAASFVLGALEASESDAVRRHLQACPEPHPEMAELHSVVPALFEAVEPVAPPAGLKARILAAAAADTQRAAGTQLASDTQSLGDTQLERSPAADTQRERYPAAGAGEPRRGWFGNLIRRPIWAPVALAAALGVAALGAWGLQLKGEVDALIANRNQLQAEVEGLVAYRNGVVAVLDEASSPGAQLAVLTPPEGGTGPTGLAAVAADGSVALVMRDLVPTAGTQVYETWLIGSDGVPIPVGGFAVGGSGSASFTTAHASLGPGVTVALTLEEGPGAQTPRMPIIVLGTAAAQES